MFDLRFAKVRLPAVLALCLAALSAPALAQNSEITFYVGGLLGDSIIVEPENVENVYNDNVTGGVRYAYFLNRNFAAEFGVGLTPADITTNDTEAVTFDADTYIFQANLIAHLYNGPVIPYVTAGVAGVHFSFDDRNAAAPPSETDFAWDVGGGIKLPFRPNMAFRFDGRYYWINTHFADDKTRKFAEISGGLSILFDF